MAIEIQSVLGQNITVVYDTLNLAVIDSSKLKQLRGETAQPALMDVPDMIVAIYPPEPLIVQIGDKRIRMTLQGVHEVGSVPLWDYAVRCAKLAPGPSFRVIAYGFNYDVIAETGNTTPATALLQEKMLLNVADIENRLQGRLHSFVPRFQFVRNQVSYDLILEAVDEQRIKAHLNAHFEIPAKKLPSSDKLRSSFLEEYRYLSETVSRLLE